MGYCGVCGMWYVVCGMWYVVLIPFSIVFSGDFRPAKVIFPFPVNYFFNFYYT